MAKVEKTIIIAKKEIKNSFLIRAVPMKIGTNLKMSYQQKLALKVFHDFNNI